MAQQFNANIATQTDHFRGSSTIEISTVTALPNFRAITGAVYAVEITGGQSGAYSVQVVGHIGGSTFVIAGTTGLGTAGSRVLYPGTYANTGALQDIGTNLVASGYQINTTVPPSAVIFETSKATFGTSTNVVVSACLYANR